MKNAKLSLAMIVKDASATLEKCLSTFRPAVDEMVVVDTGSTDNTVEIAKKYADKLLHYKWHNNFSAARNYSFEQCTGDMILWVDSDDYILPEDAQKIKTYDAAGKDVIICQYHYAHDEFGNTRMIVPRERIVRRSLGLKWEKRIHEYLPTAGRKQHVADIATHHDKQHGSSERNLKILEEIVREDNDTRDVYYLGKELLDFGRVDEGIRWLEDFTGRKDWFWEDLYHAHYMLANAYYGKGDEGKFFHHIFESIKLEPRRAEPYYSLGWFYHAKHEWTRAIQWYETCLTVRRPPELLASYMPEYYTWLPALQLCVCWNAAGDVQRAYDYNEKVLAVRPRDARAVNNRKILGDALEKKRPEKKDGAGARLVHGEGGFEHDAIPYLDGTAGSVLSEHRLNRLTLPRAEKAVAEWARVIRPGGDLTLYLPDLDECARKLLQAPAEDKDFTRTRTWYKGTIYGMGAVYGDDTREANRSGFSKEEIRALLEKNNFVVDYCENYGGPGQRPDHGTPSYGLRAVRAVPGPKVGWIAPENWEAAQTRIRVLNVVRWMRARGHRHAVVNYPEIVSGGYDVAVIGKAFDENHFKNVKWLKRHGKAVWCDLCEDIVSGEWPWVREIIASCDRVVCCSRALEEKVKPINANTLIIEDAWEQ